MRQAVIGSRVLVSMPDKFLKDVDNIANNENRSRSELIREALRLYMKENYYARNPIINQK